MMKDWETGNFKIETAHLPSTAVTVQKKKERKKPGFALCEQDFDWQQETIDSFPLLQGSSLGFSP